MRLAAHAPEPALATLAAEVLDLRARLERLERRSKGPRDGADRALLAAIHGAARELPFTVKALLARIDLGDETGLRKALTGADITTGRELGQFLRRVEGCEVAGLHVTRGVIEQRDGWLWQVLRVCEPATRVE